jgi:hypothetical protein
VLYGEAYMPRAPPVPQFFVSTSAVSAMAPGNAAIRFGDPAVYDIDDPFRPSLPACNVDLTALPSRSMPGMT